MHYFQIAIYDLYNKSLTFENTILHLQHKHHRHLFYERITQLIYHRSVVIYYASSLNHSAINSDVANYDASVVTVPL